MAKMTKEVAELTEVARNYMNRCNQLEADNAALRQQVERLAGALAQFAEPENWATEARFTYETGTMDSSGDALDRVGRIEMGLAIVWDGDRQTIPREIARAALADWRKGGGKA